MKRMQLTDEEARVIEQRRLMENRENLGYNEALRDLATYVETTREEEREPGGPIASKVSVRALHTFIEKMKRTIKP